MAEINRLAALVAEEKYKGGIMTEIKQENNESSKEGTGVLISPPPRTQMSLPKSMIGNLVPQSIEAAEHLAMILAKSDIVPKEFIGKPANILLAIMFGNEIGLAPAQALQNVMVVNGRPSMWGDAVMGRVKASDVYEASKDEFDEKTMTATFRVKRKGEDWIARTFSKADAEAAGLWKKPGPWQTYPRRMLFQRARAFALRDVFPDVLKGLRITEEERDVVDVQQQPDGAYAAPQRLSDKKKEEPIPSRVSNPEKQSDDFQDIRVEGTISGTGKNGPTWIIKVKGGKEFHTDSPELAEFALERAKNGKPFKVLTEKREGAAWVVETKEA